MKSNNDLRPVSLTPPPMEVPPLHLGKGECVTVWLHESYFGGKPVQVELHVTAKGIARIVMQTEEMERVVHCSFDAAYPTAQVSSVEIDENNRLLDKCELYRSDDIGDGSGTGD